jgi:hypothetical protein
MPLCKCTNGAKNLGQPNCVGVLERPEKLCFVYTRANDGTENKILSSDTVDDTFVSGLINQTDKSKRWFPTPVINQVNDERADFNTFDLDGFAINSSKGIRTVSFSVVEGASPQLVDAFNSLACRDISFYIWSVDEQIGGNGRVDGELKPFRIKKKTMKAKYNPPSKVNETPAMVMVSFDVSELEDDADIAYMDYGTGANDVQVVITDYTGLVDVTMGAASSISTTGFVTEIDLLYGSVFNKEPFVGGVLADFSLYNETTLASVTITSVTESPDGTYTFVIPAQTSADVLTLTFSKNGYEASSTLSITIP